MFRKNKKRNFFKRKRGSPVLDTDLDQLQAEFDEYQDFNDPAESEISKEFRKAFIEKFIVFKRETDLLKNGVVDVADTGKDDWGTFGISAASGVVAAVIGLLGALMVISAGLSAGLAIPVAVVGIAAGYGYYVYRNHVKQRRVDMAAEATDRDDLFGDILTISHELADLYRLQMESMTIKDANYLAESVLKAITEEMQTNKDFSFEELMYPASLQGVLMRAGTKMPKTHLDMNLMTEKQFNSRGMVRHTAFYVKETGEYYKTSKSKGRKYGVLFFDKKSDLDDYQEILSSTMKHPEEWRFQKMRQHEVGVLKRGSIFKAYENDKDFEKKEPMRVVQDDKGTEEEQERTFSLSQ